jgi:hypothetical protein
LLADERELGAEETVEPAGRLDRDIRGAEKGIALTGAGDDLTRDRRRAAQHLDANLVGGNGGEAQVEGLPRRNPPVAPVGVEGDVGQLIDLGRTAGNFDRNRLHIGCDVDGTQFANLGGNGRDCDEKAGQSRAENKNQTFVHRRKEGYAPGISIYRLSLLNNVKTFLFQKTRHP